MANDVKLKISGDATELLNAVKDAISKIDKESQKLKLGPAAQKMAPSIESIKEASQTSRALDQKIKQEKAGLEQINRDLAKKEAQIARITKLEKEGLEVANKRLKAERDLQSLQNTQQVLQTRLQESQKAFDRARGVMPSKPAATGGGGGFGEMLSKGAMSAVIGGSAAMMINKVMEVVGEAIRSPIITTQMRGAAIAGTTGQTLSQMQSGQFVYESIFGGERKRAGEMAQTEQDRTKTLDTIKDFLGVGLLTERGRALAFNPEKYNAMQGQEFAQNRNTALEGLKAQDPFKRDAIERLQGNATGYLGAQRTLGLNDKDLFGYLQSSTNAGFMPEQGMQATSSIMGAGGSTSMGRGSVLALQAQRSLNLNNSTNVLGSLSGTLGSAETSKAALIDIFSTAQAMGLDKSKFAAENSKFIQNVAEVVSQSGVTSRAGAANIADQMGNFATGANTMKGLENARSAYEAYKGTTTETSGRTGAINAAVIMRNFPDLMKASGGNPLVLQRMIETRGNLDVNSPEFQSQLLAANKGRKTALTAEQFQSQINKAGAQASGLVAPGAQGKLDLLGKDIAKYAGEHGGSTAGYNPTLSPTVMSVYKDLAASTSAFNPQMQGASPQKMQQFLVGQAIQGMEGMPGTTKLRKDYEAQTSKELGAGAEGTGRSLDQLVGAAAGEAGVSLKTLSEILGTVATNAAKASGAFSGHSEELQKFYNTYNKMKTENNPLAEKYYNERVMPAQRNFESGYPLDRGTGPMTMNNGDLQLQATIGK